MTSSWSKYNREQPECNLTLFRGALKGVRTTLTPPALVGDGFRAACSLDSALAASKVQRALQEGIYSVSSETAITSPTDKPRLSGVAGAVSRNATVKYSALFNHTQGCQVNHALVSSIPESNELQ